MREMPRRAIVTGASGFIGTALVRHLRAGGWQVVAVDRKPFPDTGQAARLVDVAQEGALDGLLDEGTTVFHMAASADVAASVRNPRHDFDNTFRGVFEVLEAARQAGSRVVFPSTASIFDPSNALPLPERAFPRPTSPYAAGKLGGKAYCHAYHRSYGLDVRIARLFSVYGVGMFRFAIHDIVRKIQQNHRSCRSSATARRSATISSSTMRCAVWRSWRRRSSRARSTTSLRANPVQLLELARTIADDDGLSRYSWSGRPASRLPATPCGGTPTSPKSVRSASSLAWI